ncbi:DUF4181 domain-containing protein [Planococcus sp. FY231025]|uniref:DUF4181 domain-containing protein n=1 Tax=Planococcus sp. FY231025 TaxID=3455699 RepID=UPI003F92D550
MSGSIITGLLLTLIIYAAISYFYLNKKLGIKPRRIGIFPQDRKKGFMLIDGIILILLIAAMFDLSAEEGAEKAAALNPATPLFGLLFLLGIVHAAEEWMTNRKAKAYYYELLDSAVIAAVFLIIMSEVS